MVDSYITLQRGSTTHYSKYYTERLGSTAYLQRCPHGGLHSKIGAQLIATTMTITTPKGDYNTNVRMNMGHIYGPVIHLGVFEKFFAVQILILNYGLRW
eukprot:7840293-Pyramimonas_sp.AAC.1